jgi:hypothetical protein
MTLFAGLILFKETKDFEINRTMKTQVRFLAVILFLALVLPTLGQVSQVQYEVIYNPVSCLYEAHAHVIGASLVFPSTVPYPSKFSVVVPAAIANSAFTVVQNVNPPGMSWTQGNSIYAPAADPASDYHAFTISGGGGGNAYPVFTVGTDILLFKFTIPHVGCENGVRCFINEIDPNSAQPGMSGIDFSQAFKTAQSGVPSGVNRYQSNIGSPVSLPIPAASSSSTFSPDGSILYLSATGSSTLGCNNSVSYNWTGSGSFVSTLQNPSVSPYAAPGSYTVTVKDNNGCMNTSSVAIPAPEPLSQVQYEVIYNPASCIYEAYAHVIGSSLSFPSTIPFPSKFTVVVPAAVSNQPFTVIQNVNPPGMSWAQGNSIYEPAADPNSDFHAFTISGGGGGNAYPVFTPGTDILLFKFSVPHVGCESGVRCFVNGSDPNSAQPGMSGIDFSQAFKTAQSGVPSGVNRYQSNTGSPVSLPIPAAGSSGTFSPDGSILYLSASGSSMLGCNNSVSYNWTGPGGFVSTLQNPEVSPFPAPGEYTVNVQDNNGCTHSSSVLPVAPVISISGHVYYDNISAEGINGATVELRNSSDVIIGTKVTADNPANSLPGYYFFHDVPNGSGYKLSASYNGTWGGNNATDDLIVQLHSIGAFPLTDLREVVADVNGSSTITALDALYIKLRTIGSVSSYPAGDWKSADATLSLSGIPVSQDLPMLCQGDVNGSYSLGGSKGATFLSVVEDEVLEVPAGKTFLYNIACSRSAEPGAMTLFLGYDPSLFEVTGISGAPEGLKYSIGAGKVSIAWADTKPMHVNAGDVLLSLTMQVKGQLPEPARVFTMLQGCEFADIFANPYDNFDLKMSKVSTSGSSGDLVLYNFPNPCAGYTNIAYTIPVPGHARLFMTDICGKTTSILADHQASPGQYVVRVDPVQLNMAPGIYFYKLSFNTGNETQVRVNKMFVVR